MRVLVLLSLALAGCNNACQQICVDVAVYAEQECGQTVPEEELAACREAYADPDDATLDQCAASQDADALREWWDCDDLSENWTNLGG